MSTVLTVNKSLPNVDRSLSDDSDRVLSDNVQRSQYSVPSFWTESFQQGLSGIVGSLHGCFLFLELDLAGNTSDLVQQLSCKGD